jgi:hypothetical protein
MKLPLFATQLCAAAALTLTLASPAARAQVAAAAPPASAASASPYAVRPDLATKLNQAVDLFRAGKAAEAKVVIDQAQAASSSGQPLGS